MTLNEFVAQRGSQELAAHDLGVTVNTMWRWLHGKKISKMALAVLKARGITPPY